mmetsp:Transcript_34037/g.41999  ORF Transcript_34037/g.41999 Transcript_34037/m.41999 type:complete len:123 (-) Transcript_34037:811-1179(-)
MKSFLLQTRSERGSLYRGVSKNGTKWQVMVVRGTIKKYVGAIDNELQAARLYDKYSLIIKGFEAKTNFNYSKRDILALTLCSDNVIACAEQYEEHMKTKGSSVPRASVDSEADMQVEIQATV